MSAKQHLSEGFDGNAKDRTAHELEPLWTVEEVAEYLRLEPNTVRAMARRGELPAIKLGRRWRFHNSAIKGLLRG